MLIRDLEMKTGLDRATIRFYEKEGLIMPNRKENGYREYTTEHQATLLKIKLLRQLGLSLETIKDLHRGALDFSAALNNQIEYLEAKIEQTTRAKAVCVQIRDDKVEYATLDAQHYLQLFEQREPKRLSDTFSEDLPQPFHPWRRYFARIFDYSWITLVFTVLFVVVFRVRPLANWLSLVIQYGSLIVAMPTLAAMLHHWGTTPGKWLFGLSTISENGNKLDYEIAIDREGQALVRGFGLGLPIFGTVRLIMSYFFYKNGRLNWDEYSETRYHTFGRKNKALIVILASVFVICDLLIAADYTMPKHRGPLTIGEFAQNYNFYATATDENASPMLSDGSFDDGQTVYIDLNGDPTSETHEFEYVTQNNHIQTISYTNTWDNVRHVVPVGDGCAKAALTAVVSQRGANVIDLIKFVKIWKAADFTTDGEMEINDVVICWDIEQINCLITDSGIFVPDSGNGKLKRVSVVFTINLPTD